MFVNTCGEFGAALRGKFFRVIETNNAAFGIKDHGGGDDRAKERAAAGFVETGDAHPAELSRRSLETGRAESAHWAEILARRAGRMRSLVAPLKSRGDSRRGVSPPRFSNKSR